MEVWYVVLDTRIRRYMTWQVFKNFSVYRWNQIIINLFLVIFGWEDIGHFQSCDLNPKLILS